jgi:uncharacterized LabA/DUF88 family protein
MENKLDNKKGPKYNRKFLEHQKIGIFIDAENVELSGFGIYSGRTDYKKLLETIGGLRRVIRIIYYKPQHKEISDEFKKFWFELGGEIKQPVKNADAFIVIDAVTLADKLDVVVLVGGDKDYLPLIWYVKSRGCKTEVWSYPETTSSAIKEAADFFYGIDENYIIKDAPRRSTGQKAPRPTGGKPQREE